MELTPYNCEFIYEIKVKLEVNPCEDRDNLLEAIEGDIAHALAISPLTELYEGITYETSAIDVKVKSEQGV